MRIRLATGLVLLLLLLTAVPTHAGATGAATVNLVLSDLPTGYVLGDIVTSSTAALASKAGESVTLLNRAGMMGANNVTFHPRAKLGHSAAIAGIVNIDSNVLEFRTEVQAGAYYQDLLAALLKRKHDLGMRALGLSAVGAASTSWTLTKTLGATTYGVDIVSFIRGRYVIAIMCLGLVGKINSNVPDRLAHVVDHRIQAHR